MKLSIEAACFIWYLKHKHTVPAYSNYKTLANWLYTWDGKKKPFSRSYEPANAGTTILEFCAPKTVAEIKELSFKLVCFELLPDQDKDAVIKWIKDYNSSATAQCSSCTNVPEPSNSISSRLNALKTLSSHQ